MFTCDAQAVRDGSKLWWKPARRSRVACWAWTLLLKSLYVGDWESMTPPKKIILMVRGRGVEELKYLL